MADTEFLKSYRDKRVILTGDSGFKGSWLAFWLNKLGAKVLGLSLPPRTSRDLYYSLNISQEIEHQELDIRDRAALSSAISNFKPDIIFHLAAQSLVSSSYKDPYETYSTNVIGTLNVFDAARFIDPTPAIVNITTDKCYRNTGAGVPFSEDDPLGGLDPYSGSKACAEVLTESMRHSFFNNRRIASARAGNVIGGGDWCDDRIVPDLFRAIYSATPLKIRNPDSIRPWQFVLEPLHGYLRLGAQLLAGNDSAATGWNFGPTDDGVCTVKDLIQTFIEVLNRGSYTVIPQAKPLYEAATLRLNSSKSRSALGWSSILSLREMTEWTSEGYDSIMSGDARTTIGKQIEKFESLIAARC